MLARSQAANLSCRGMYVRELVEHPATLLTIAVALGVTLSQVGTLAAIAVFVATGIAIRELATWRSVRRALDTRRREEDARDRRCDRETRLQEADIPVHELRSLEELVASMDRAHISRYELDELLDRFADLSIAHARCTDAMRSLDRVAATRVLETTAGHDTHAVRHRVIERQLESWNRHQRQANLYHEEMLALGELVKLIALREAFPDTVPETGEIERRLAQIDADDDAHRELEVRP